MFALKKSLLDYAVDVLNERKEVEPMAFKDLWDEILIRVEKDTSLTEKTLVKIELTSLLGKFYTNLSLDGRIINLPNNKWELRENLTYDEVHVDLNDAYSDEEGDDYEDDEEKEEEEEEEGFEEKPHDEEVNPDELLKGQS